MLCLRKAFSPSTQIDLLNTTKGTVDKYLQILMRRYNAKNKRHLMYLRYKGNNACKKVLKASERGLQVLSLYVQGKTYDEIGTALGGISGECVYKHVRKMADQNACLAPDELVVLYADWENANIRNGL